MKRKSQDRGERKDGPNPPEAVTVGIPGVDNYVEIDGSMLEGGGQIIRSSFALASLLGRPIRVSRIRNNRPKPGLHAQHLAGVRLVSQLHGDETDGAHLHSRSVAYAPGGFRFPAASGSEGSLVCDIGTAGSIGLIVQIALPCLVFANPSKGAITLEIRGGTHVSTSPTVGYLSEVFLPIAARMGVSAELRTTTNGFYPKGAGESRLVVRPTAELRPIRLMDRGEIESIAIRAHISRIPQHVADREAQSALQTVKRDIRSKLPRVDVETLDVSKQSFGEGTWVDIVARTTTGCILASNAIGERSKRAEEVGQEAARHIVKDLQDMGCVDEYLQDQLIIFMALANGTSEVRAGEISLHTKTSIKIAEMLTGAKFTIEQDRGTNVIRCEGIGFRNPFFPKQADAPPTAAPAPPPAAPAGSQ